jgi:tetrahydromethanopterin:alpha-L-glutamate ligase
MNARVAIFTDEAGWHGRVLRRAFRARGIAAKYVRFTECRFDPSNGSGLFIPGFSEQLPDAVFVRSIPVGTFEQITLRLSMLHALRELGVPVYNDARVIERSVDKAMTTFLLRHHGVPTLPTWVTESRSAARRVLLREAARGNELVSKPLFGSQGKGLQRLGTGMDVPDENEANGVWYLQRFLDSGEGCWHDWRVLVAGGRPIAAMLRRGATWVTNVAQGARAEAVEADGALAELAVAAAGAVGADYAGVDLMRNATGSWYVIEVNSIPAWQGLQRVARLDIAAALVKDLATRYLDRSSRERQTSLKTAR